MLFSHMEFSPFNVIQKNSRNETIIIKQNTIVTPTKG